jgi:hypothetical protein
LQECIARSIRSDGGSGVAVTRMPLTPFEACQPRRLAHPAQHLHDVQSGDGHQELLVLTGAKVAFQDEIQSRGEMPPGDREEHRETCRAEQPRMRCIPRTENIEQGLFDVILAEEQRAVAPRQAPGEGRFAAARQPRDE